MLSEEIKKKLDEREIHSREDKKNFKKKKIERKIHAEINVNHEPSGKKKKKETS